MHLSCVTNESADKHSHCELSSNITDTNVKAEHPIVKNKQKSSCIL